MLRVLSLFLFVGFLAGCDSVDPLAPAAPAAGSSTDDALAFGLPSVRLPSVRARGAIEAIGTSSLTVGGITFDVLASTLVLDRNRVAIPFGSLTVGMTVQVEGKGRPDGTAFAKKIKLEDAPGDEGVRINLRGPIQAIDGASLTVQGQVFTASSTTKWLDRRGNPVAPSAFTVGMIVEAEGHLFADGSATAKKVKMQD